MKDAIKQITQLRGWLKQKKSKEWISNLTYKKSNEDEIERKIQFHKLFRIKQIEIKRKWTKSEKKKTNWKATLKCLEASVEIGKREERKKEINDHRCEI